MIPILENVCFEVTSDCNLNCKYCYNHWRPDDNHESLNSYKKAYKTLKLLFKRAGISTITFTGGEPFIGDRFSELVLYSRLKNKNVNIITNGNSADETKYKEMINMGVQLFELPYHSTRSEIHDSMTTIKGSWNNVVKSIRILLKYNAYVVPVIVITRVNHKYIGETINELSQMGLKRIIVNRFNIGGNGKTESNKLMLNHTELKKAYDIINDISIKQNLTISSNVCTPFCILNPDDYRNLTFSSCPVDSRLRPITVDINGDVRLCNHSPVTVGNIYTSEMDDILNSDYVNNWNNSIPDYCIGCNKYSDCRGGCRAASEQLNLPLNYVDPIVEIIQ